MLSIDKSPPYYVQATGADSIAAMLSANCTLTSLNLGWNSIRMASAVTVAESLRDNHTLRSLGLAYNSFSDFASQVIFRGSYADAVCSLGNCVIPDCEMPVPYYHARYLFKHTAALHTPWPRIVHAPLLLVTSACVSCRSSNLPAFFIVMPLVVSRR